MIKILNSSLVKTVLNPNKIFQSYKIMLSLKYPWIWNNLQGYRFEKVSLNVDSYKTADSTVSVCESKELELKFLKTTFDSQVLKMCRKFTANKNAQFLKRKLVQFLFLFANLLNI